MSYANVCIGNKPFSQEVQIVYSCNIVLLWSKDYYTVAPTDLLQRLTSPQSLENSHYRLADKVMSITVLEAKYSQMVLIIYYKTAMRIIVQSLV
jgi:hypothetical protein